MGRTRVESEHDLRDQIERMAHRSATIRTMVEQYTAPLEGPAWVLMRLIDRHGPLRSSELAERSRVSRPSVSRSVTALEQAGLVAAEPDPHDGRAALVALSGKGRRYLAHMAQVGDERIKTITSSFTAAEVETLARLLTRLNDNADAVAVVPDRFRLEGQPV